MKQFITIAITLFILLEFNFGVTLLTEAKFINYSFIVGLVVSAIIWFFTSKGGFTSRHIDITVQGISGIKDKQQEFEVSLNTALFTSAAYTVISLVITLIYYQSYFFH